MGRNPGMGLILGRSRLPPGSGPTEIQFGEAVGTKQAECLCRL